MYYLNTAAIFFLGHPYIESTTVLSDSTSGYGSEAGASRAVEKAVDNTSDVDCYLPRHRS